MTTRNKLATPQSFSAVCVFGVAFLIFLVSARTNRAQDPQSSAPAAPSAATQTTSTPPEKSSSLKQAVRTKKVLTEDDLHPPVKHKYPAATEDPDFNPVCPAECEQRVRDEMLSDPSTELEFRNKFAAATQRISDDRHWGTAEVTARHSADEYCDLEHNRAKYAYPGATEPLTSEKMSFTFILKERDAYYKFKNDEGEVKLLIQNMRSSDPLRASIMQSHWSLALEHACRGVEHL